ncbi:MAG: transcription-repair coupling factor, partial [Myxococcota bacterium]
VDGLKEWREQQLTVVMSCGSKGQALRLQEMLSHYGIRIHLWEGGFTPEALGHKQMQSVHMHLFLGRMCAGFLFPREQVVFLSEEDIFGPKARRRVRKRKGALLESELRNLHEGDLVIHKEHGMARYAGLLTMTLSENVHGDFLLLEFQGRDKLYLPVTNLHQIERYTGSGKPALDRLRGNGFEKKKRKAQVAIQAMAGELLKLYAEREAYEADAIDARSETFSDFEACFPFEETPDQRQAIQDVLEDMHRTRCMDRLICGDVGYGKTEVAIRAAFAAAFDGYQVAVLVPTTVLAQQHGLNFMERMEGYPIKVGVLSRFQTKAEQKEVLKQLKEGTLEVVIGTHRLLSKDVHFKRLGLLVVDEEQRFGVKHKEKIKQVRKGVHCLTLSATPIPRTLEMSMMGIRDLSLITTPPHDRLAIRTVVAPLGEEIVRASMMREFNRGGQVFFVHNRVQDIYEIKSWLERTVPEARIVVGHGQMREGELERVMLDFMQGQYNVLLCTSIIESGLDISRANTILVNRADAFGLAQLYQIRGRVGRGRERAYAVLLVPAKSKINPEAKQRLSTLQRFTELGAGFSIARHDLEMRGAGNFLGKQQSGHMHAIGVELYMEMLQEAVAELQGRPIEKQIEPEIKLGFDAYIPDFYIPDVQLRLQCYRRLSMAQSEDELDLLSEEFHDRFGPFPEEVNILFQCMEIRLMCKRLHVTLATSSGGHIKLHFHAQAPISTQKILQEVQRGKPFFRLLPDHGIESCDALEEGAQRLSSIKAFLRELPARILDPERV